MIGGIFVRCRFHSVDVMGSAGDRQPHLNECHKICIYLLLQHVIQMQCMEFRWNFWHRHKQVANNYSKSVCAIKNVAIENEMNRQKDEEKHHNYLILISKPSSWFVMLWICLSMFGYRLRMMVGVVNYPIDGTVFMDMKALSTEVQREKKIENWIDIICGEKKTQSKKQCVIDSWMNPKQKPFCFCVCFFFIWKFCCWVCWLIWR